MLQASETARHRHLDQRQFGLQQEAPGVKQSDTAVVADRGCLYVLLEHSFELTLRDTHLGGQPGYGNWIFYVAFHQVHDLKNAGVRDSETEPVRRSLGILRMRISPMMN